MENACKADSNTNRNSWHTFAGWYCWKPPPVLSACPKLCTNEDKPLVADILRSGTKSGAARNSHSPFSRTLGGTTINGYIKSDKELSTMLCMSITLKAPTAALDLTCTLWRWIVPGRSSVPVDAHSDIRPLNPVASITSVLNVFAQVVGRARAALHASMRGNFRWAAWRMTWRS